MNNPSKLKHKAPESLLHALSDPTRQEIVQILAREGELTAAGIYEHFNVSKPAISQHLAILRDAGVVNVEKRAQFRVYSLNTSTMGELESWTSNVRKSWESRFRTLEKVLEQQKRGEGCEMIGKDEVETGPDDVNIVWLFDSPVETVWKAFTDPEIIKQWFGPSGSTGQEFLEHDFRVGGNFLIRMETPGFGEHFNKGTFRKIVPMKELVYTYRHMSDYYLNQEGKIVPKSEKEGPPRESNEIKISITFERFQENGTRIKFIEIRGPVGHGEIAFVETAKSFVRIMQVIKDPWL